MNNPTKDLQCIFRAGCLKPSRCRQVGHCTSVTAEDLKAANAGESPASTSSKTVTKRPTYRQIIFNWLMGESDFATKLDGYWGGSEEVAKADELIAALGLPARGSPVETGVMPTSSSKRMTDRELLQACVDAMRIAHRQQGSRTDWSLMMEDIRRHLESSAHETTGELALTRNALGNLVAAFVNTQGSDHINTHIAFALREARQILGGPYLPVEPVRKLSASEDASFDKTLARSPRRMEPTRNQADPAPSDAGQLTRTPRADLPNSLGTSSPEKAAVTRHSCTEPDCVICRK